MPPLEQVNNATRIALLSLALSAVALIVVLFIAARPTPQPVAPLPTATPVDNTTDLMAELEELRVQVTTLQQSVVDTQSLIRAVMARGGGSSQPTPVPGGSDQLSQRLDRVEASLASAVAKLDAICRAIQSSAFAPSGFACP